MKYRNSISLSRQDLIIQRKNRRLKQISIHDFKHSSITQEEMHGAEFIIFYDKGRLKILKDRYAIQNNP